MPKIVPILDREPETGSIVVTYDRIVRRCDSRM
jgi:hypothetical protein